MTVSLSTYLAKIHRKEPGKVSLMNTATKIAGCLLTASVALQPSHVADHVLGAPLDAFMP